jgi:hypothetical protein
MLLRFAVDALGNDISKVDLIQEIAARLNFAARIDGCSSGRCRRSRGPGKLNLVTILTNDTWMGSGSSRENRRRFIPNLQANQNLKHSSRVNMHFVVRLPKYRDSAPVPATLRRHDASQMRGSSKAFQDFVHPAAFTSDVRKGRWSWSPRRNRAIWPSSQAAAEVLQVLPAGQNRNLLSCVGLNHLGQFG